DRSGTPASVCDGRTPIGAHAIDLLRSRASRSQTMGGWAPLMPECRRRGRYKKILAYWGATVQSRSCMGWAWDHGEGARAQPAGCARDGTSFTAGRRVFWAGSVMTLPQSGRLDGSEQPQGLPDARAQRL